MPIKIQPGDIIVPAKHKYPEGAIRVDSVANGVILGFPEGGGFQYAFDKAAQEKYDFRVVSKAELEGPTLRKGRFSFDGGTAYEGYHNGRKWNGWAMPFFEREVFKQIMADWDCRWDEATGTGTIKNEYGEYTDECDVIEGRMNEELGKVLYTFDGYCWDAEET